MPAGVGGRDIRHQFQGLAVKHLHATGLIVGDGHIAAILGDGTTNAVTRLHHTVDNGSGQQVNFGEAAIPPEYVAVSGVPGVDH